MLSRGLIRTGAVGFITEIVLKLSRGKKELTFILIFVTVDFASAFINNTPLVVLFIPIAIIGTVFLYFASPRILPERTALVCEMDETKGKRYIAELIVPQDSELIKEADIYLHAQQSLGLT